jgi:hypothetical protein
MPIKGVTEIRRMPRLGKIHLGVKVKNAKGIEYPKATDYFVCSPGLTTSEYYAAAFERIYGKQPKELDVVIPCENPDVFFPQFYRRYGRGTGLACKGDGEVATEVDPKTGEMHERECKGKDCPHYVSKACRTVGNLMVILPKVDGIGCWQIDTGSFNSIVQINSAVAMFRGLAGHISGLLLKLVIVPKEVQAEGKKKTVHVLDLRTPPGLNFDQWLTAPIPNMQRIAAPNWTEDERRARNEEVFGPEPSAYIAAPPRVVNGDAGQPLDVDEGTELPVDADTKPDEPPFREGVLTEDDTATPVEPQKPPEAPKPARRGPGPDPKLAQDDMTTFWAWALAHGVAKQAADTYLRAEKMDARKALVAMQAVYGQKAEA